MPDRVVEQSQRYSDDLRYWVSTERKIALRLIDLIESARRDPLTGLGKPEPLKRAGPNVWSRRITDEYRLVYRVEHDRIVVLRARGHYDD
jgi:toxin YoeB